MKLIVDLIYEGGLVDAVLRVRHRRVGRLHERPAGRRRADPRDDAPRPHRDPGRLVREAWIAEADGGFQDFLAKRRAARSSQLEEVGRELRTMMPWLHSEEKVPPS